MILGFILGTAFGTFGIWLRPRVEDWITMAKEVLKTKQF